MTCIVGLVDGKSVWIGGDSAGVEGLNLRVRKDVKVFSVDGRFLIGYTSSFRMGQLLRFGFHPPRQRTTDSDYEYMCTDFIDAVRKRLKAGGCLKVKDGVEEGGCFLVGYNNRLYIVDSDLQVGECIDGFDSVGCGEQYALGSLFATKDSKKYSPKDRILLALRTAEYFSAGVRGPFTIGELDHSEPNKEKEKNE